MPRYNIHSLIIDVKLKFRGGTTTPLCNVEHSTVGLGLTELDHDINCTSKLLKRSPGSIEFYSDLNLQSLHIRIDLLAALNTISNSSDECLHWHATQVILTLGRVNKLLKHP
jgi:hypothetical protein